MPKYPVLLFTLVLFIGSSNAHNSDQKLDDIESYVADIQNVVYEIESQVKYYDGTTLKDKIQNIELSLDVIESALELIRLQNSLTNPY